MAKWQHMPGPRQRLQEPSVPVLLAVLLLPIVAAYAIMARFAFNLPIADDYHAILDFASTFEALPTLREKLLLIPNFQHIDYKFVFEHLVVALDLAFGQHVHLGLLTLAGNLFLLPILALLWFILTPAEASLRGRLLFFLPIPFLFITLNYAEAVDFPTAALDYFPSILFSLLALHLLSQPPRRLAAWAFPLACLFALLAYFAAANSFAAAPLGLFVLLPRRQFGRLFAWLATFALGLLPYLVHYQAMPRQATRAFLTMPLFLLSFLGAAAPFIPLFVPTGLIFVAVYVIALRTGFFRSHPSAVLMATWLIASAVLAAVGRSESGLGASTASRYRMFSDLMAAFCYSWGALRVRSAVRNPDTPSPAVTHSTKRTRRLYVLTLAVAVLLCCRGDLMGYRLLRARRLNLITGLERFQADPARNSPLYFADPANDAKFASAEIEARQQLQTALANGLYTLPRP